ncbi:unnamed protein product [Ranitomeya imitator]|uniref:Methyltransferase-like protein 16 n=1 Tax=Ranitomeya imitator TaxID=111125 RepID=A0ABN9MDG8_9NEOB|nr:unnamed protein product [Ranitomeya imitator]
MAQITDVLSSYGLYTMTGWSTFLMEAERGQEMNAGFSTTRSGDSAYCSAVSPAGGTGASCIYPLLGTTLNGWYFLATEVDDICYNYAKKNVEQNHLAELIKVNIGSLSTVLQNAVDKPMMTGVNSRNPRRPPPSSVNTGGITEIMAEGGELEFVKRIIHDSLQLKKRLRWYSCMLGKKCSLAPLKEELRIQGVETCYNVCTDQ